MTRPESLPLTPSGEHAGPKPGPAASLLDRLVGVVSTACGVAASLMIFASVIITCQMIWVRFVMNRSTIWQTEAVIYLMIGATLIGLPYVQRLRGHVCVDLVPNYLPAPARRVLMACTLGLTLVLAAAMAWYGFELFYTAFARGWRSDTVWGVPLAIPYAALPVGFGLFLVQLALDLWNALLGEDR
ncbi:MAG TPA: TRAP transporter small permease [Paracoccaceae bacterium]|nr:TRAP transporter small permease [Paracoccaceae bacterium]